MRSGGEYETGKITNSVISRSVLKNIKPAKNSIAVKPSIGADASVLENGIVIASDSGFEPVYTASNNIYARGGRPQYIQCCVNLAQDMREIRLKEIMQKISADCAQLGLVVSGGHTQVEAGNTRAVVAVTAVGFTENVKEPHAVGSNMAKPGDDIIMTKCIGIGGVQYIINNNREKILEKYVEDVVKRAYGNRSDLSIAKEACIAIENGAVSLHDMSQGGVYAALWDMAEASGTGLLVDFRAIAVRQEIIEICEIFDINPYELNSCGSLLITSSDSERIIKALAEEGIDACVIGKVTDSNDKIINNLDEVRFLDKPVQDEIYRLQEMQSETNSRMRLHVQ